MADSPDTRHSSQHAPCGLAPGTETRDARELDPARLLRSSDLSLSLSPSLFLPLPLPTHRTNPHPTARTPKHVTNPQTRQHTHPGHTRLAEIDLRPTPRPSQRQAISPATRGGGVGGRNYREDPPRLHLWPDVARASRGMGLRRGTRAALLASPNQQSHVGAKDRRPAPAGHVAG